MPAKSQEHTFHCHCEEGSTPDISGLLKPESDTLYFQALNEEHKMRLGCQSVLSRDPKHQSGREIEYGKCFLADHTLVVDSNTNDRRQMNMSSPAYNYQDMMMNPLVQSQ